MKQDVVLVDIMSSVVASMRIPGISIPTDSNINFQPGMSYQIIEKLREYDESITMKGLKFPMIAMMMPFQELKGGEYPHKAFINKIVIAALSTEDIDVKSRYLANGVFKTVLYPIYNEFLNCLAKSIYIVGSDPEAFVHNKMDYPAKRPMADGITDFVDTIEISNLELILNQIKTC